MKPLYFAVLLSGAFGVLAGVFLMVVLAARGQTAGDGMYMTTSSERQRIRRGEDPARLRSSAQAPEPDREPLARAGDPRVDARPSGVLSFPRSKVEMIGGNGVIKRISRPGETISVSISGSGNTITIGSGTGVETLSISGSSHSVVFEDPARIHRVLAGGSGNELVVSERLDFEMIGSGATTRIANAAEPVE